MAFEHCRGVFGPRERFWQDRASVAPRERQPWGSWLACVRGGVNGLTNPAKSPGSFLPPPLAIRLGQKLREKFGELALLYNSAGPRPVNHRSEAVRKLFLAVCDEGEEQPHPGS